MALLPHLSEQNAERCRISGNLPYGLLDAKTLTSITLDHWPLLRGCFEVLCHEQDNDARVQLIAAFRKTASEKIVQEERLTRLAVAHSLSFNAERSLKTYIKVLDAWHSELLRNQEAA
ncbi:MAG: hypothetical protein ABJO09_01185 [Hyphomicrobiales bacterium]